MRYLLVGLAWYLDFLVYHTATGFARGLFFSSATWSIWIDLGIFVALRLVLARVGLTPGQWLLGPAVAERQSETGRVPRQWTNLVLGTLLFLEGTKSAVRWLEMDRLFPFMGHIPTGTEQVFIGLGIACLMMAAGVALIRFRAPSD